MPVVDTARGADALRAALPPRKLALAVRLVAHGLLAAAEVATGHGARGVVDGVAAVASAGAAVHGVALPAGAGADAVELAAPLAAVAS